MLFESLTDEQFQDFSRLITAQLGIQMPPSKKMMLSGRLARRARELGFKSIAQYHQWFFSNNCPRLDELQNLFNTVTTNKTEFLREAIHFDFLIQNCIPYWEKRSACRSIVIWSAGCSTGEEPYSLAMVLADANPALNFTILATDISTRVLQKAREATYSDPQLAPLPPAWRHKFFLKEKKREETIYRVRPEIRQKVRFGILNLLSHNYRLPLQPDAIFFRNVMIYFSREVQLQILRRMLANLKPPGWLFIGLSESLNGLPLPLKPIGPSIYQLLPKNLPLEK